jgi:hypothetical protein
MASSISALARDAGTVRTSEQRRIGMTGTVEPGPRSALTIARHPGWFRVSWYQAGAWFHAID